MKASKLMKAAKADPPLRARHGKAMKASKLMKAMKAKARKSSKAAAPPRMSSKAAAPPRKSSKAASPPQVILKKVMNTPALQNTDTMTKTVGKCDQ